MIGPAEMNGRAPEAGQGKFELGQIVQTANSLRHLNRDDVLVALGRHSQGDWSELDTADWAENELSLREGLRLFSVYRDRNAVKFYIITEHDRSVTTVLLPEDY